MRLLSAALLAATGASQQWQYESRNIATIALGIDCPDDSTCFMGVSIDGYGNAVLKTTDGGQSYQMANLGQGGQMPAMMLLMSTAAAGRSYAVTTGMGFGNTGIYSTDGEFFDAGQVFCLLGVSQNIKTIPGTAGGYGMVGDFVTTTGAAHDIALSTDFGQSWSTMALPDDVLGGSSRYAHYVSDKIWYVAGGSWPAEESFDSEKEHAFSELLVVSKAQNNSYVRFRNITDSKRVLEGYIAGVVRTVDGGLTWERLFYAENEGFYLNQIDCPTDQVCFAVGEGGNSVRILRTVDGGATWDNIFSRASGYSLMGIHFFNEAEGWACGMKIEGFSFHTLFLYTRDGGETWREDLVGEGRGSLCTDMSFHGDDRNFAHATAIEPLSGQSSTMVYK